MVVPWGLLFGAEPQPVAVAKFDASGVFDATPVFLSEDSVAVLVGFAPRASELLVFRLGEGKLELASRTASFPNASAAVVAVSGNRPLVTTRRGEGRLYSQDLSQHWDLPVRQWVISRLFPGSKILGRGAPRDGEQWELIELGPEMRTIRQGAGKLRSVSDQAIAVRREDTLFFETPEGRPLGSIPVPPQTKGAEIGELAGKDAFFLELGDSHEIFDLQGKLKATIPSPPGWGFQRGWSADGRRLLLDHFTSTDPSAAQSDGELIHVVDTASNKSCFRLARPLEVKVAGAKHADISPSGRLAVVATLSAVSVYRLPETCSGAIE